MTVCLNESITKLLRGIILVITEWNKDINIGKET